MTSISPPANNVDQSVPVARNPNMPGSSSMNNFLIPSSPLLNSKNSSNCKMQKPIAEIGFHESPRLLPSSGVNGHFGSAQLNTTHDSPSSKRAAGLSLNFPPSPYNTSPRSPNVPPRRFQTGSEQHNSFSPAHQNSRFNAMSHDRKKGLELNFGDNSSTYGTPTRRRPNLCSDPSESSALTSSTSSVGSNSGASISNYLKTELDRNYRDHQRNRQSKYDSRQHPQRAKSVETPLRLLDYKGSSHRDNTGIVPMGQGCTIDAAYKGPSTRAAPPPHRVHNSAYNTAAHPQERTVFAHNHHQHMSNPQNLVHHPNLHQQQLHNYCHERTTTHAPSTSIRSTYSISRGGGLSGVAAVSGGLSKQASTSTTASSSSSMSSSASPRISNRNDPHNNKYNNNNHTKTGTQSTTGVAQSGTNKPSPHLRKSLDSSTATSGSSCSRANSHDDSEVGAGVNSFGGPGGGSSSLNVLKIRGNRYNNVGKSDIIFRNSIGSGVCGTVWKCEHKQTGVQMAVKVMTVTGNLESDQQMFRDMNVNNLQHTCPYIVTSFGCIFTDQSVYLCMEQMETCLEKLLKERGAYFEEHILARIALCTLEALEYLKSRENLMHRDIKPSNILVSGSGVFKLCDFGISGKLVNSNASTRSVGCVAYLAPERVDLTAAYDARADVWALGITIMELALQKYPYSKFETCSSEFEVLVMIKDDPAPRLPPSPFSEQLRSFTELCAHKNKEERLKHKELLKHPFIVQKGRLSSEEDVMQWLRKYQKKPVQSTRTTTTLDNS